MLTVEAAAEEGVAVRGVGGEVSVKAETGVEWREVERRSTLLEPALDCVPFLDAVGAILNCAAENPARSIHCSFNNSTLLAGELKVVLRMM
jgi:hypothetical protein